MPTSHSFALAGASLLAALSPVDGLRSFWRRDVWSSSNACAGEAQTSTWVTTCTGTTDCCAPTSSSTSITYATVGDATPEELSVRVYANANCTSDSSTGSTNYTADMCVVTSPGSSEKMVKVMGIQGTVGAAVDVATYTTADCSGTAAFAMYSSAQCIPDASNDQIRARVGIDVGSELTLLYLYRTQSEACTSQLDWFGITQGKLGVCQAWGLTGSIVIVTHDLSPASTYTRSPAWAPAGAFTLSPNSPPTFPPGHVPASSASVPARGAPAARAGALATAVTTFLALGAAVALTRHS